MKLNRKPALSLAVTGVLLLMAGVAAAADVPLGNWAAPPAWTSSSTAGTLTKLTDVGSPVPFIPMAPCRMADTRGAVPAPPINGGGILAAGVPRNWTLTGNSCGIPAGAVAVSANFTVVSTAGTGFLVAWPQGGVQPGVAVLVYTGVNQVLSNAAVVPVSTGGQITVLAGVSNTHLIMDVNGYYGPTPANQSNFFQVTNNSPSYTIGAQNNSTTCGGSCGVYALVASGGALWGVSTTGGEGVYGTSVDSSAPGVHGVLTANVLLRPAVLGEHQSTGVNGIGVEGKHAGSGWGVYGHADGTALAGAKGGVFTANSTASGTVGVQGQSFGVAGVSFGVYGSSSSTSNDSAGVKGVDGSGEPAGSTGHIPAGVRGDSNTNVGVLGVSQNIGTAGLVINGAGGLLATGILGLASGVAGDTTSGIWGVFAVGNLGATGAKHFVEPHATDASKTVTYSSLEGREVGTYFRGTARASGGRAIIEIPDDFRMVTDEEGLTVQLTPVGELAMMAVMQKDLNQIVVQSSRDVTFDYLIQGVRRAFRNFVPVGIGYEFMPLSADARMPAYLTEEARRRLIQNGTYNPDGTVNMSTAERVGWAEAWRKRAEREKAAAAAPKVSTTQQQVNE